MGTPGGNEKDTIESMVADNVHSLIRRLEKLVEAAEANSKEDELYWSRFIRFWEMMEALVKEGSVSRTELVTRIFMEHYSELDLYEEQNIVCFHQFACPLIPHRSQLLEPEKNLLPPETIQLEQIDKDQSPIDLTIPPVRDLENVIVHPGSPRMSAAFKRILEDTRIIELQGYVQKKLKKRKLKSNKKDIEEDFAAAAQIRRDLVREHEVTVNSYPKVFFFSFPQFILFYFIIFIVKPN